MKITGLTAYDIRYPTSRTLAGSDAMNKDPDYSVAYVVLSTDGGLEGHGLSFTIGRGTEVVVAAIEALRPMVVGHALEEFASDLGGFWRHLTGDSQLRWIGPEKGAIHLATAAVVNAVWDLVAKRAGKPLWRLLADMTPAEIIACIDFRYITDALSKDEALAMLERNRATKGDRIRTLEDDGYPCYTTSAGWLGYSDDKLRALCRQAVAEGFTHLKIKVGRDIEDDLRRSRIIREEIGYERQLMMDANQVWDVGAAIENMKRLAQFKPMWIEEPTSPDDVLGHATIAQALNPLGIGVATGEHCQNRVMFKQFLQAEAMQYCQIDSTRLGGVNEILSVYLMAAKFGVPVCPHAGGIGLCEYVQHLSMWDYVSCSATFENRVIEYANTLQDHFVNPAVVRNSRYIAPGEAGYGVRLKPASMAAHVFPNGSEWAQKHLASPAS